MRNGTHQPFIHSFIHPLTQASGYRYLCPFLSLFSCFLSFLLSHSWAFYPFALLLSLLIWSQELHWLAEPIVLMSFSCFFPFMLACFRLTFLSHSVYILSIFLLHAFYVNVLFSPSHACVLTFFVTFLPWVWERRISGNQWYTSTLDCSSLWHCNNVILFMLFIAEPLKKNITPHPCWPLFLTAGFSLCVYTVLIYFSLAIWKHISNSRTSAASPRTPSFHHAVSLLCCQLPCSASSAHSFKASFSLEPVTPSDLKQLVVSIKAASAPLSYSTYSWKTSSKKHNKTPSPWYWRDGR